MLSERSVSLALTVFVVPGWATDVINAFWALS
jgi:hypothetical protein